MPAFASAEESATNPVLCCSGCPNCMLKSGDAVCMGFCDGCVWNGKMVGPSSSRDGLQLKLMTMHEEPSCVLLGFWSCCCPWNPCLLLNWLAGASVTCNEREELSEAKWEACTGFIAEKRSCSVVPGNGGPQVWDSAICCAIELVFLKILHMVQESCFGQQKSDLKNLT